MMTKCHFFLGTDLRSSHDGLGRLSKKHALDLERLKAGEVAVFVNRGKDKVKTISWNGVLCYLRLPPKRLLDLDTLDEIPKAFTAGGHFNYNKALKATLISKLNIKGRFKDLEVL